MKCLRTCRAWSLAFSEQLTEKQRPSPTWDRSWGKARGGSGWRKVGGLETPPPPRLRRGIAGQPGKLPAEIPAWPRKGKGEPPAATGEKSTVAKGSHCGTEELRKSPPSPHPSTHSPSEREGRRSKSLDSLPWQSGKESNYFGQPFTSGAAVGNLLLSALHLSGTTNTTIPPHTVPST